MAESTSVSPNPRPKLGFPLDTGWDGEQRGYIAHEYNAMVDEIEKLSAHIVSLGSKPGDALKE